MFNVKDKRFKRQENLKPNFKFVNDLENIKVRIRQAPSMDELRSYIPDFLMSTWSKTTTDMQDLDLETKDKFIYRMLRGKFLPTALESININVTFEGITWHDVTHLIRYRSMSFAGDCSGDKYLNERDITISDAIKDAGLENEYKDLMSKCMQMYCDLLNTGNVSIQDARLLIPRSMSTFYHVRMTLGDAIKFIRNRIDRQIQPKSDNIMAYQLFIELCKIYPLLSTIINIDEKNIFYVNESQTNFYSGFFKPYKENDVFEYDDKYFLFNKTRDEMYGNETFNRLKEEYIKTINEIKEKTKQEYKYVFDDLENWR